MEERRSTMRTPLQSTIVAKKLGGNGDANEVGIDITDVSKTGVGFTCKMPLEIGTVYEAYLTIWTKEVLHAFVEIVRIEKKEDCFQYGGIFIGMPELDLARIDIYQTFENENN